MNKKDNSSKYELVNIENTDKVMCYPIVSEVKNTFFNACIMCATANGTIDYKNIHKILCKYDRLDDSNIPVL
jgi:hypothetical protein